jgi:hypothetical protein
MLFIEDLGCLTNCEAFIFSRIHHTGGHISKHHGVRGLRLMEGEDPYFYIPKSDFVKGVLEKIDPSTKKCYWLARLSAGGKTTDRVLSFDPSGPLENLVRIEVSALSKLTSFYLQCLP